MEQVNVAIILQTVVYLSLSKRMLGYYLEVGKDLIL